MRALIVDDEAPARRRLRGVLRELSAITDIAECSGGGEALAAIARASPDVVFLDVEMPSLDGLAVAAKARGAAAFAVVFVTAHAQHAVRAFELEALDYLLKPFEDERVARAVRRAEAYLDVARRAAPPLVERLGEITVDCGSHEVTREGRTVVLRPKEYELLIALMRRGGAIASRSELLREVWGYSEAVTSRTVDTHIASLRRQLERDPAHPALIVTVRQYGYRLERALR